MYIKKKDEKLFNDLDVYLKMPKNWDKFICKIKSRHNLIIKNKNEYYCTNCKHIFKEKCKINSICKCPYCHQKYLVKRYNLKYYEFNDNLGLIDKFQNYYIIRHFELKSYYNNNNNSFTSDLCEYGRQIYDNYISLKHEIRNDHIINYLGGISIVHNNKVFGGSWKYFNSPYNHLGNYLIYYPYNLKRVLKDTQWEYSQLWVLARKEEYFDIAYLLRNYTPAIELLTKLKLYKLALCPKTFNVSGSFINRFGIDKQYLAFMQKYNLDIDELNVLKYTKEKNINIIKYFKKFNLSDVESYKIDLVKLKKKTDIAITNFNEYIDYLKMASVLEYDLKDNKILYPKNINVEHDKILKLYKINKNKKISKAIKKRYLELEQNTFKKGKYIIFPAKDINSLIEESKQQNNCVKTYSESYAKKECDIYFMRLSKETKKSLVTVEVKNNKVVQARTKNNYETSKEQNIFLSKFEDMLLKKYN